MLGRSDRDSDRLTLLYKTHGPAIYARCRRLLVDDALAEDAAQETFIRVHRHLDAAPSSEEALRWIYRIATNYCLNKIRDRKNAPIPVEELASIPAGEIGEERLANRDLASRLIREAPEQVRTAAWLYHVDGMDQAEVAEVLGVSRRTVVNYLSNFARHAKKFVSRSAA
jgi:RNA polymerase sigma-70 factor (ECF subfamily)